MFSDFDELDNERLVCQFCEVEGTINEVMSAFQDMQRRSDGGEDGGPLCKGLRI